MPDTSGSKAAQQRYSFTIPLFPPLNITFPHSPSIILCHTITETPLSALSSPSRADPKSNRSNPSLTPAKLQKVPETPSSVDRYQNRTQAFEQVPLGGQTQKNGMDQYVGLMMGRFEGGEGSGGRRRGLART
ncbi:hypothetical protein MMC13_007556 [Lambiella insularis]|nr:hypothetical protein [Lambiella insularis]